MQSMLRVAREQPIDRVIAEATDPVEKNDRMIIARSFFRRLVWHRVLSD